MSVVDPSRPTSTDWITFAGVIFGTLLYHLVPTLIFYRFRDIDHISRRIPSLSLFLPAMYFLAEAALTFGFAFFQWLYRVIPCGVGRTFMYMGTLLFPFALIVRSYYLAIQFYANQHRLEGLDLRVNQGNCKGRIVVTHGQLSS